MMMDGEWRVAFIKAEHPELAYGTAPMPVLKPSLYGAGYINGTIIGIPKNGKNRDAAWALVRYLTTNDHALATFSNGIRNVPSTVSSTHSKELQPDPHFATFGESSRTRSPETIPITAAGAAHLDTFQSFLAKWQSGKVEGPRGRARGGRQADRREARAGRSGRSAVSLPAAAGTARAVPAAPSATRRRAKRRATWRRRGTILLFLSPWIVGFSVFFGYPLVMSGYLSFFHYDLLNPPRWVGLANYRYLFHGDPQVWPAIKNTLWLVGDPGPAAGAVRVRDRVDGGAGASTESASSARSSTSPRSCRRSRRRSRSSTSSTPRRAGQHDPRETRHRGPALVQRPGVGEAIAHPARALGDRQHDDHLPGVDPRRSPASLRVGAARRRGPVAALPLGDAPAHQPRDPLRGRARRDPGDAVLHAGVRRRQRRRRPGLTGGVAVNLELGYPEGSTLFYPILLYYQGFRFFNMGYAAAMAMLLLAVAFLSRS